MLWHFENHPKTYRLCLREDQLEPLIAIGACCVPLAVGAIGFSVWGNKEENSEESSLAKTPPVEDLSLGQRLRLRRRSDEAK